jgi:hypothetical protein
MLVLVAGLLLGLAGLTATAYAAPSYHPAAPGLTGVWHTTIKVEAMPEEFYGLWSFYADGNFLDANSFRETNPGIWMGAGKTYALTFWGYLFDEQGQTNGKGKVRLAITLDDADHFTAQGVTETFDLAGQPMSNEFEGPFTVEGERMQMELP